ncbi:uncharacterized protein LOC124613635 [Schistocerca americana]|uniref:uncharacterized protein LOC124613635 n=1 Tax=Schistocerca americana TaxID=7009 RepID=UPI001F4F6F45|nr:uncharacterized protein LOC124613635 [Schistocerca americana]
MEYLLEGYDLEQTLLYFSEGVTLHENVQHLRSELSASNQQVQSLKQQLHSAQYLQDQLQRQVVDAQTWATTLEAVLDTAATEIKNAIMDTEKPNRSIMTTEEKEFALDERDSLLNTLLDLIRGNLIQFSKLTPKKNLKSTACSAMYMPGNLGIISKMSSGNIKTVMEDESARRIDSRDEDSDSSGKTSLAERRSHSSEAADISGKQTETPKASTEKITEVEPIELKGSFVIRESSIFTQSSSFLRDISSAMIHAESEELDDILPLNTELRQMSSQTSNISKKSSLRSRSSDITGRSEKSFLSQERSKVRFQDKTTDTLQQKSSKQPEKE